MSLYFTTPIAKPTLWGGKTLRTYFGFPQDFGDDIGQAWAFSAQPGCASVIQGGEYDGRTLDTLWKEKPEVFRSRYGAFPFIISLVAPEDDLSIQVHPDDEHARAAGYVCGKNEAWVFLKAPRDGQIIYGHHAKDEAELRSEIRQGHWRELVSRLAVGEGDAVYIPAGVLHALSRGSVVYEIQQATDVTYRFYDYDRRDAAGRTRPLQLEEAVGCLKYGDYTAAAHPAAETRQLSGGVETIYVNNESFVVRQIKCDGTCRLRYPGYQLATVTAGQGACNGTPLRVGQSFLVPAQEEWQLEGCLTLMTTAEE